MKKVWEAWTGISLVVRILVGLIMVTFSSVH